LQINVFFKENWIKHKYNLEHFCRSVSTENYFDIVPRWIGKGKTMFDI